MPRKRKSDQSSSEKESTTATIVAEPEPISNHEEKPSFVDRIGERTDRVAVPDPFELAGDYLAGVHFFVSRRDRQMAIKFDEKPSQPVIDRMKESGFRWDATDRVWARSVDRETAMGTRIEAERVYEQVRNMIRQEKGIASSQEVPF